MEIHWVLGHMNVEENEKADEPVKMATEARGIRACPEQFVFPCSHRVYVTERK